MAITGRNLRHVNAAEAGSTCCRRANCVGFARVCQELALIMLLPPVTAVLLPEFDITAGATGGSGHLPTLTATFPDKFAFQKALITVAIYNSAKKCPKSIFLLLG